MPTLLVCERTIPFYHSSLIPYSLPFRKADLFTYVAAFREAVFFSLNSLIRTVLQQKKDYNISDNVCDWSSICWQSAVQGART